MVLSSILLLSIFVPRFQHALISIVLSDGSREVCKMRPCRKVFREKPMDWPACMKHAEELTVRGRPPRRHRDRSKDIGVAIASDRKTQRAGCNQACPRSAGPSGELRPTVPRYRYSARSSGIFPETTPSAFRLRAMLAGSGEPNATKTRRTPHCFK